MRAAVVVVENPFYAVTDENGNYEIKNVPKGSYLLRVWKMDHKPAKQEVNVPAQGVVELNFTLPQKRAQKAGR
ncbi:MAG: carboxypeptidase-like regulatory domain-containing protein [bacterium]|nr:carboxypeptidase-like regulatory domain-containing protein [bacterium]